MIDLGRLCREDDVRKRIKTPEMWLMYYKWNLRTTCNDFETIVFTVKHGKEQAMSLLINEAFQQQARAEGSGRE
jgi:hypothetical protein